MFCDSRTIPRDSILFGYNYPPYPHQHSHLGLLLPLQNGLELPQILEELLVQLALLVGPVTQQSVGAHEEVVERQVRELPLVRLEADPVEKQDGRVAPGAGGEIVTPHDAFNDDSDATIVTIRA